MDFRIEKPLATVAPKKSLRKYPFPDLKPGTAFFVPADMKGKHRSVMILARKYNIKHGTNIQTVYLQDGRLQVYIPATNAEPDIPALTVGTPKTDKDRFFEWLDTFEVGEQRILNDSSSLAMADTLQSWVHEYVKDNGIDIAFVQTNDSITLTSS